MALPANLFKWSLFMEGARQGFSESFFFTRGSPDLQGAITAVQPFFVFRAALLGDAYSLIGSRVARVTDGAGVRVRRFAQLQNLSKPGTQTQVGIEPSTSGLVVLTHAPTGRKKNWFMSGLWELNFPGDGRFEPAGGWLSLWQSYQNLLRQINAGWVGEVVGAKVNVTNYVMDPVSGLVTLTLNANPGFPTTGDPFVMNIKMPKVGLPLNGPHPVVQTAPLEVTTRFPIGVEPFSLPGKAWISDPTLFRVTDVDGQGAPGEIRAVKAVRRARGKVSIATRGRARTIRRW